MTIDIVFHFTKACVFTWANVTHYRVGIVISLVYAAAIYYIYTQGTESIHSFQSLKEKADKEASGGLIIPLILGSRLFSQYVCDVM